MASEVAVSEKGKVAAVEKRICSRFPHTIDELLERYRTMPGKKEQTISRNNRKRHFISSHRTFR